MDDLTDSQLLDLWATGFGSGMMSTLVAVGYPVEVARAETQSRVRKMCRDPAIAHEAVTAMRRTLAKEPWGSIVIPSLD